MEKHTLIGTALAFLLTVAMLVYLYREVTIVLFLTIVFLVALGNIVFFVFILKDNRKKIVNLKKEVTSKNKLLNRKQTVEERITKEMPTGIIILNDEYIVAFANQYAKTIFSNPLEKRPMKSLHVPLYKAIYKTDLTHPKVFKIYEEYYEVHYHSNEMTLYLYKVGERERLKRAYNDHTAVIGVLHFDNFEDALSVLDVQERNEIQGKFLGVLDQWAEKHDFHLAPVSNSKIYVYMHRSTLEDIINGEFSVLNDIVYVSKENDLIITLSGGFACANIPVSNLAGIADEALDLALSRGGDQIVINIQGEEFKYFGGNTNTQEKRTRISSRIHAKKLDILFESSSKVFIMPHNYPDNDALASAIGVLNMALASKKEAYIVLDFETLDKTVKKILRQMEYEYILLLDYFISPEKALQYLDKGSLTVLVDHHSKGQLISDKLVEKSENIAIIDHHRKLSDAIENAQLSYIEPYASSSCELVVEMINVYPRPIDLTSFEATVMLSGMIVDTNNFMYRTGARTFEAAAILRKYGADPYKVKTILRESLKDIQIKADLLQRTEVVNKRFALVEVPDDYNPDRPMLAKIADDLLEIDHVVAAFAIGNVGHDTVGISARSLEGFNVQVLMEKFGGGGHLNNAGAQLEDTDINTVKTELIHVLEESKQEGRPMKVILQKDIKKKGKKGEVIEVAPGYANYLLTSQQAIEATPENMQLIEDAKAKLKEQAKQDFEEAKVLKQRIDYRAVKVYVKLGKNGKLFGKINTKQIADAFKEQHGIDIDKRKIQLNQPITALGTYQVDVKLHKDINATFELLVLEQ